MALQVMKRFYSLRCYHCAPHVIRTYPTSEERAEWIAIHNLNLPDHDLVIFEEQL